MPKLEMPPELAERGQKLWNSMEKTVKDPIQVELLKEACRLVDNLDRLYKMLQGDMSEWASIRVNRTMTKISLDITDVLAQQRQSQLALKQITTALTVAGARVEEKQEDDRLDELAARRGPGLVAVTARPATGSARTEN